MNLLKTIIERLNQRIEVANIFDKIFTLCELNENGNDKAWVHYIGNGQGEVVTNFDAKQGTIFWAKRSRVTISKTESFKVSGCKQLYLTTFPLTCYAVVRKSHLPCDSEDATDWLASRIYRLTSGTDVDFKISIGVIQYEVIPNSYTDEIKSLTSNYEWACVAVDIDVNIVSASDDGCYDVCSTGDIPLPNLQPCVPCLTEVAVDGVTITGNGTTGDPLVAIGGGGGGSVNSVTGTAPIASSGGANPDISITQADGTTGGYLSAADWNTFDGKQDVLSAGSDISIVANVVNNTAPDQVVVLTAGTDIAVSGTYPNFTIDNTAPSSGGTVTSVDLTMPSAFSVSGNPITTSGTLAVTGAGITSQYIRGDGSLDTFPTALPPSGAAGGDLSGTYPNPEVHKVHGVDFQSGTPTADDFWIYGGSPAKWQHGKIKTVNSVTLVGNGNITTGTVTAVSGTSPIVSSGGNTPDISIPQATAGVDGYLAAADFTTFAAKQDALVSGTNIKTINSTSILGSGDITIGVPLIYKDTTNQAAVTGVTTNVKVVSQLVPANTYAVGDIIQIKARLGKTGVAGIVTLRVFANTADSIVTPAPTLLTTTATTAISQPYIGIDRNAVIKSATNTQTVQANASIASDAVFGNATLTNSNIDWTVNQYIIFAIQNGSAADSTILSYYLIEKL